MGPEVHTCPLPGVYGIMCPPLQPLHHLSSIDTFLTIPLGCQIDLQCNTLPSHMSTHRFHLATCVSRKHNVARYVTIGLVESFSLQPVVNTVNLKDIVAMAFEKVWVWHPFSPRVIMDCVHVRS